jgi:hypothetical protein
MFLTGVKCPDPGISNDSYRDVHGLYFGDTIDYRCAEGYRVVAGIYKLECTEDRTWTYPLPECVSKYRRVKLSFCKASFEFYTSCNVESMESHHSRLCFAKQLNETAE